MVVLAAMVAACSPKANERDAPKPARPAPVERDAPKPSARSPAPHKLAAAPPTLDAAAPAPSPPPVVVDAASQIPAGCTWTFVRHGASGLYVVSCPPPPSDAGDGG
jgi:hypothetical protein